MKIRMKFTKKGPVKFVGHLDTLRLFQRAVKVASVPVAYSQGFSPHSLVYFALPLGVGVSSEGEYMDVVTSCDVKPEEIKKNMNAVLVDGIEILDAFEVTEKDSLMSLVQAASYEVKLKKEEFITLATLEAKMEMDELIVLKKGKKGINPVDLKPLILDLELSEDEVWIHIQLKALAGSSSNLNPDLLVKALLEGVTDTYEIEVIRKEMYAHDGTDFVPLYAFGRHE